MSISNVLSNWQFIKYLPKTLESPLDCKEIQPVHSEGDQPWDFFGGNDAEAETPVLWPPHAKSWLIGKDSDAGRHCGQEEKGTTEDGMAGWHHRLDGHESEWTPGVGDGQGGLACCDSWGRKEPDTTERLTWWNQWHHCLFLLLSHTCPLSPDAPPTQAATQEWVQHCFLSKSIACFIQRSLCIRDTARYWQTHLMPNQQKP